MNNCINTNYNNSVAFKSRLLKINRNGMPDRIYDAICNSTAIDKFIKDSKPKTLWGKLIDFFRKNEILDISYSVHKGAKFDKYAKSETVQFDLIKGNDIIRSYPIHRKQAGSLRPFGVIAKDGEDTLYKAPRITSEEQIIKTLNEIKDLDDVLISTKKL